jgi:hypothetical protein
MNAKMLFVQRKAAARETPNCSPDLAQSECVDSFPLDLGSKIGVPLTDTFGPLTFLSSAVVLEFVVEVRYKS